MPLFPILRFYVVTIRTVRGGDVRESRYIVGAHSAADALVVAETTLCPTHIYEHGARVLGTVEALQCLAQLPPRLEPHDRALLDRLGHVPVRAGGTD